MRWGITAADLLNSNKIRSAVNPSAAVYLLFEPWSVSISCFSGIPGKKCGTIIFAAEELSNCRVSITGQTGGVQYHRSGRAGSAWQPRHFKVRIKGQSGLDQYHNVKPAQVRITGQTAPIQNHRSDVPRLVSQVRQDQVIITGQTQLGHYCKSHRIRSESQVRPAQIIVTSSTEPGHCHRIIGQALLGQYHSPLPRWWVSVMTFTVLVMILAPVCQKWKTCWMLKHKKVWRYHWICPVRSAGNQWKGLFFFTYRVSNTTVAHAH